MSLLVVATHIALGALAAAPSQSTSGDRTPLIDQQREFALALSACPPDLAEKAGVYVLGKAGYIKVRESQNGFSAIVGHLIPTSVEPQCLDAEGTRVHLPPILKLEEWRAQGKRPDQFKQLMMEATAKGLFPQPKRIYIDYMLSTENLPPANAGTGAPAPYPPHVMFFAPGVTNADFGSNGQDDATVLVTAEGTSHAVIIVPVAQNVAAGHKHPNE